ncbi:hypothetical protein D3C80_1518320 [compost metagenome]
MVKIQTVRQPPAAGNSILNSGNIQRRFSLELIRDHVIAARVILDLFHSFIKILVRPVPLLSLNVHTCCFKNILADDVRIAAAGDLPHARKHIIFPVFLQLGLQILLHAPILHSLHIIRHVLHPITDRYNLACGHESGFIIRLGNNIGGISTVHQQ